MPHALKHQAPPPHARHQPAELGSLQRPPQQADGEGDGKAQLQRHQHGRPAWLVFVPLIMLRHVGVLTNFRSWSRWRSIAA